MDFVTSLSTRLANVPGPDWHTIEAMEGFQDRYMSSTFAPTALEGSRTLIAWSTEGRRLGYIHMRPGKDGVTDEPCGYVSLLALGREGMAVILCVAAGRARPSGAGQPGGEIGTSCGSVTGDG